MMYLAARDDRATYCAKRSSPRLKRLPSLAATFRGAVAVEVTLPRLSARAAEPPVPWQLQDDVEPPRSGRVDESLRERHVYGIHLARGSSAGQR
jgi:hypothetical protein